jgi:RalA-binding protein 1
MNFADRQATLESYLQSLLKAPLAEKGDLCEFLSTDHVSGGVSSIGPMSGRKEGYLTKKGKNFGG